MMSYSESNLREDKNAELRIFSGGLALILVVLGGIFGIPKHSRFPIHDFLDHVVALNSIWAKDSGPFRYLEKLPFVLGGDTLPSGALGIPDLSFQHWLYSILSTEWAVSLSEIIGRALAFAFMFFLLRKFPLSKPLSPRAALFGAFIFSLMPYGPSVTWSMVSIALAGLSLASISRSPKSHLWLVGLFIAPQISPTVAWGSFLVPLLALMWIAWKSIKKEALLADFIALLVATAGFVFSSLGLITVFFEGSFQSHRLSWKTNEQEWFTADAFHRATKDFPSVFFNGADAFMVGNQVGGILAFIPGVPVVVLFVAFLLITLEKFLPKFVKPASNYAAEILTHFKLIVSLWAIQLALTLLYVSEASGLTYFYLALGVPFQVSRVIALSPLLWAVASAFALEILMKRFGAVAPKILALSLITIIVTTPVFNLSARGSLLSFLGKDTGGLSSVSAYFMEEEYGRAKEALGLRYSHSRVLSFGLDPMIAVANRISSSDGYVYNYPLEYKIRFREIIQPDPGQSTEALSSYDEWGSRLYLPNHPADRNRPLMNLCSAKALGVDYLFSSGEIQGVDGLSEAYKGDGLIIYSLSPAC
jgi:hypothetical protein